MKGLIEYISKKLKKEPTKPKKRMETKEITVIVNKNVERNKCPICGYLLAKNLEGKVEIKCKRCKSIAKFITDERGN